MTWIIVGELPSCDRGTVDVRRMKIRSLGMLIAVVAACGGSGETQKDAANTTDAAPTTCSPLTQMGCAPNEKCTWVIDQTDPTYIGHVGCVANTGTAQVGDNCTFGSPGMNGFDNCAKGAVCSEYRHPGAMGQCKAVCDQSGGTPMCDDTHSCIVYSKLFATGSASPAAAGVCNTNCSPLLDNDFDGSGALTMRRANSPCGSDPTVGCYAALSHGVPPKTAWTCMTDLQMGSNGSDGNLRHRSQCTQADGCIDPDTGSPFVNGCSQGYQPVLYETTGSTTWDCIAECHPLDCYDGSAGQCGGIGNPNRHGQYPDSCDTNHRVGLFQTGPGREECAYQWKWEVGSGGAFLSSQHSMDVGFCMDHMLYKYDPTGGNNPTMPLPGCELLKLHGTHNAADLANPTVYFGAVDVEVACVNPMLAFGSGSAMRTAPEAIVVDGPRFLYRRVAN